MTNEPQGGIPYAVPNSSLATVSLITGILGLTLFPIIGSIVAVITGMMARREIQDSAGMLSGDGMAVAGLVMGWIGVGLTVVGCCFAGAFFTIPFCIAVAESGEFWILPGLFSLLF